MELYGTALVSGFHVSQDFKDSNQWQHLGIQSNELFLGMHAMLLVGYRKLMINIVRKRHYLLQNRWKRKASHNWQSIGSLLMAWALIRA